MGSVDQFNADRRRITFYLGTQLAARLERARMKLDPQMDMSAFLRLVIIEWCDEHGNETGETVDPGVPSKVPA
jgi:hypothetical protein